MSKKLYKTQYATVCTVFCTSLLISLLLLLLTTTTTTSTNYYFSFLGFPWFFFKIKDSRHAQLSKYAVFHEESDFQVKNKQFLEPGGGN